jgi:hypothetical protein
MLSGVNRPSPIKTPSGSQSIPSGSQSPDNSPKSPLSGGASDRFVKIMNAYPITKQDLQNRVEMNLGQQSQAWGTTPYHDGGGVDMKFTRERKLDPETEKALHASRLEKHNTNMEKWNAFQAKPPKAGKLPKKSGGPKAPTIIKSVPQEVKIEVHPGHGTHSNGKPGGSYIKFETKTTIDGRNDGHPMYPGYGPTEMRVGAHGEFGPQQTYDLQGTHGYDKTPVPKSEWRRPTLADSPPPSPNTAKRLLGGLSDDLAKLDPMVHQLNNKTPDMSYRHIADKFFPE